MIKENKGNPAMKDHRAHKVERVQEDLPDREARRGRLENLGQSVSQVLLVAVLDHINNNLSVR